jgi:hypothetical protein
VIDLIRHIEVQEPDRRVEKVLDLPARSRFGGGRAEPLIGLIQTSKNPGKTSILSKYEDDPDIPMIRNSKTLESWPGWFR